MIKKSLQILVEIEIVVDEYEWRCNLKLFVSKAFLSIMIQTIKKEAYSISNELKFLNNYGKFTITHQCSRRNKTSSTMLNVISNVTNCKHSLIANSSIKVCGHK